MKAIVKCKLIALLLVLKYHSEISFLLDSNGIKSENVLTENVLVLLWMATQLRRDKEACFSFLL